jgi:hypothetical protein
VRQSAEILKKLPGFVEGHVYEKKSGESDVNIVTPAVWRFDLLFWVIFR